MYDIKPYSFKKANQLGVEIKPSNDKNKKIDVIKNDKKLFSIGNKNYKDYPTYLIERGKDFAEKRKKLYKIRHKKDRHLVGTRGFYADKILW